MAWLAKNNFATTDRLLNTDLNNLANDDRNWGGDVNAGGHKLANVILEGTGGFDNMPSPLVIAPGADQTTVIRLQNRDTPTSPLENRWLIGRDPSAETGANAGSDFAIQRFDDAGNVLGTPIFISRKTGLISMGAQLWTAGVDGGGQTLSNVVIPGYVPSSRQIIAGTGLTGGGDLTANRTLSVVADSTNQRVSVSKDGAAAVGPRKQINFVSGTNVTLSVTDDNPNNRVNVSIASSGSGGGGGHTIMDEGSALTARTNLNFVGSGVAVADDGTNTVVTIPGGAVGSQTPWLQDIVGAGFNLTGVGRLSVNTSSTIFRAQIATGTNKNIAFDPGVSDATAVALITYNDAINNNVPLEIRATKVSIPTGGLAIGKTDPLVPLDVVGNVNANGSYYAFTKKIMTSDTAATYFMCENPGAMIFQSSGGLELARITCPGKLFAIGTDDPKSALHVQVSSVSVATTRLSVATIKSQMWYFDGSAFFLLFTASGDPNGTFTDKRPFCVDSQSGRVGIGSNPGSTYQLTVTGDIDVTGNYRVNGVPIATGGFTSFSVVTRTIGVPSQNLSGKVMMVMATVSLNGGGAAAAVYTENSSNPTIQIAGMSLSGGGTIYYPVTFLVMPGHYYKISQTSPTATVSTVTEWT